MNPIHLRQLLTRVQAGALSPEAALEELKDLPFRDLEFARVDHHRSLRCGAPEVIYGASKKVEELLPIARSIVERGENLLVTRVSEAQAQALLEAFPAARHEEVARAVVLYQGPQPPRPPAPVLVLCAGTSDLPVAAEARLSAEFLGSQVETLHDVGVAGMHRLLAHSQQLRRAGVLVVVAGMEGALPSVVSGLVERPVIAVPTSIGYGASLGGLTALFAMLNSCAPGLTVVNIDNGFGAGYAAAIINRGPPAPPAS